MDNNIKICPFCHNEININATRCKHCQKWLDTKPPKNFLETLLLNWFLGIYGIHRFYTGYYAIGVIQLLTLGGCGIWSLVDFISICLGNYKDSNGAKLEKYNGTLGIVAIIIAVAIFVLVFAIAIFTGVAVAAAAVGGVVK